MNRQFVAVILILILGIGSLVQLAEAREGAIPPTPAYKTIRVSSDNVTASNSTAIAEIKCIGGISCIADWFNNLITISFGGATGTTIFVPDTLESLTNVTDNGCSLNQVRVAAANATWVCADQTGGAGEANTASNAGVGVGVFRSKVGVDLVFHSLLAGSGMSIVDIGDELRLNSTGGGLSSVSNQDPLAQGQLVGTNGTTFATIKGINGTTGQINVANGTNSVILSLAIKSLNQTCSAGDFINAYDNATGIHVCGTPTVMTAITSVSNAGLGTVQLVFENGTTFARIKSLNGISGNITLANGTDVATINLGDAVVMINGLAQTITKALTLNSLLLGGNADANANLIQDYGVPASGTDVQRVNRLALHDLTIGDCPDGSPIEYQTSNSTFICGVDGGGASGIQSIANAKDNADALMVYENSTSRASIKGINGTAGQISVSNGTATALISLVPKMLNQTCTATDKFSSYNNVTGVYVCTADVDTNSGGNATVLKDLGDVDYSGSAPLTNNVLQYNGTSWTNATIAAGGNVTNLNDAGDVVISSPLDDNFLRYNGIQWVNEAVVIGSGNATNFNDLGDVIITTPAYQHMVVYDGTNWVNRAFSINNQTVANDFQIVGINNVTGVITRNQFSVNTLACGGTDKISSIDNVTGAIICTADVDTVNAGNATRLNELGDVAFDLDQAPATNEVLKYNGTHWTNATDSGLTAAITSINSDTTAAQTIAVQSGNLTITDAGATHTIGFGVNPVITSGSAQTVTKNMTANAFSLGGIMDAIYNRIANLAIPFDVNDAQRVNRIGLVNMTVGVPANGTVLKFLASNNTAIWQDDNTSAGASGNATVLNELGDVAFDAGGPPLTNEVLTYNGTHWTNETAGAGASDRIFEGDSEVEVIDLGTGFVEVGIDGIMEFNFTQAWLNMSTNELNFKNNSMPATPPAGNIQIYAKGSTNSSDAGSSKLYAIDDRGMNYTLHSIPQPFFKKWGLVNGDGAVVAVGLFSSTLYEGTESGSDDADGVRTSTTTGTTIGGDAGLRTQSTAMFHGEWNAYMDARIKLQGTGGYDTFIGFNSDGAAGAMDGTGTQCNSDSCAGIGLRGTVDGGSTWRYIVNDGDATADATNSNIANNTSVVRMQIWSEANNNRWCFQINTNPITCLTTEIPAATTDLAPYVGIATNDATSDTFMYYYAYIETMES